MSPDAVPDAALDVPPAARDLAAFPATLRARRRSRPTVAERLCNGDPATVRLPERNDMTPLTRIEGTLRGKQTPQRTAGTVLLLHASGSSARQWQALAEALQPGWRVLAPDLHGHGERAPWSGPRPMTLADEAELAGAALAAAGGGHVVGHSYGGAIALTLASRHPTLVRSVVAYEPVLLRLLLDDGPGAETMRDGVSVAQAIRDHLANDRDEAAARLFVDHWSGRGAWDLLPLGRRAAVVMRMASVLRQYDALVREPSPLPQLARLRPPMLLLHGERTVATTRRIADLLRGGLPHAQHESLGGLDHMSPVTRPEVFNRRVLRFLSLQCADAAAGARRPERAAAAG